MRFRAVRPIAAEPSRWLVYLETSLRSTVVEFGDYLEAVTYAQAQRRLGETHCIEIGDTLGRVVWHHTEPT